MLTRTQKKFAFAAVLALIGVPAFTLAARAMLQDSPKAVLDQAWQIVDREYVDPQRMSEKTRYSVVKEKKALIP